MTATHMPDILTGPDGCTYYRTPYTGTALGTARARNAGWVEGEATFEYWADPESDAKRLYTTADFRMMLD